MIKISSIKSSLKILIVFICVFILFFIDFVSSKTNDKKIIFMEILVDLGSIKDSYKKCFESNGDENCKSLKSMLSEASGENISYSYGSNFLRAVDSKNNIVVKLEYNPLDDAWVCTGSPANVVSLSCMNK